MNKEVIEMLEQSNMIEDVNDPQSLEDALMAWNYIVFHDNMSLDILLRAHQILMTQWNDVAGKIREYNVRVGSYVAPSYTNLLSLISEYCDSLNDEIKDCSDATLPINKEDLALKLHIEFEKIHPFGDGNGRIGRILWNWFRIKVGLPIITIYNEEKEQYYAIFQETQ